jgi:hypothetical protein
VCIVAGWVASIARWISSLLIFEIRVIAEQAAASDGDNLPNRK